MQSANRVNLVFNFVAFRFKCVYTLNSTLDVLKFHLENGGSKYWAICTKCTSKSAYCAIEGFKNELDFFLILKK